MYKMLLAAIDGKSCIGVYDFNSETALFGLSLDLSSDRTSNKVQGTENLNIRFALGLMNSNCSVSNKTLKVCPVCKLVLRGLVVPIFFHHYGCQ